MGVTFPGPGRAVGCSLHFRPSEPRPKLDCRSNGALMMLKPGEACSKRYESDFQEALMKSAVEDAAACIWESYSEPLTLSDIAKSAILSRFHFSRVFRDATGVSPGRFLTAVRIYHAKRLLASTSMSVTDISLAVGYNSLGSFTNRFTDSVGASPSRFRKMWIQGGRDVMNPAARLAALRATVTGTVTLPPEYAAGRVFIGAFDTPIVQRQPSSWCIVEARTAGPVSYELADVPAGVWHIRAVAAADSADPEPWTRRALLVGGEGTITVSVASVTCVDITLHARTKIDLPILYALPNLERQSGGDLGAFRYGPEPVAVTTPAMTPASQRM
jgi:AraC family transcriptional regulator